MSVRQVIKNKVTGTARSIAHKGLKVSSKSLERTSKAIQELKTKMDEKADSFLPENKEENDKPEVKQQD